jgi:hypothetical protein
MARRDIQIIEIKAIKGAECTYEIKIKYGASYQTITSVVDVSQGQNFMQVVREYIKGNKLQGTLRLDSYEVGQEYRHDTNKDRFTKQLKHWEQFHHERGLREYLQVITN